MKVRIGTRIGEVFAECDGFIDKPKRIATGSPLMGRPVFDLDEPVIKTCYAVFAILGGSAGSSVSGTWRNCIGCGECREVCPVGLDPEDLYKKINAAKDRPERASECHGCGCCEVVCPSRLPLSTAITAAAYRGIS